MQANLSAVSRLFSLANFSLSGIKYNRSRRKVSNICVITVYGYTANENYSNVPQHPGPKSPFSMWVTLKREKILLAESESFPSKENWATEP